MGVLYALYEPLDEKGLNFLKNIANLGFVWHSQYLCFRLYSKKWVTVEQCREIKNKYGYFWDKEFEKEFGES